jgi:hypothetical protein
MFPTTDTVGKDERLIRFNAPPDGLSRYRPKRARRKAIWLMRIRFR